jgi:predicted nucleic acid-binding protein
VNLIDTSLIIERISEGKPIDEYVCMISLIEYPMLLEYAGFHGKVVEPNLSDLKLAHKLQKRLAVGGRMKPAADLIIAATCLNLGANLLTLDSDFEDIATISELKVILK